MTEPKPKSELTEIMEKLIDRLNEEEVRDTETYDITLELELDFDGDASDDAVPFELGQIVKYADGDSTRLARIVSIDTSHDPSSYVIKLDDSDDSEDSEDSEEEDSDESMSDDYEEYEFTMH